MTARPDDHVVLGQPRGRCQPVQAGEELPLGQVAGGAEQYEDVRGELFVDLIVGLG